ncbi:MAG TPA: DUF4097 family beta strand repeat-containing protein [Terracidiphilus sp.]|nr:DUF4097 family beta strand repeat-containing protein [Terracidiphilus sp.]
MKLVCIAAAAMAMAAIPVLASEATFERTLSVNGKVELTVNTGSGNIHITRGSSSQVHIVGRVRSDWGAGEERVREIANNPPIEQTGNIIRIGGHHEGYNHVSIAYEIQAPEDAFLDAGSGSGDITDEGVGENAKISTGSGNIHASGLRGGFSVGTGSGDIQAEQSGDGDVKAQTGSGTIELKGVHGGLRAGTGSGDIKVSGAPSADWKLETGSGSIEMWPGDAGFTLDASTGSGSVHTDQEMTVQGSFDKHHITGKVHGGGPMVRVETGSGDIHIH